MGSILATELPLTYVRLSRDQGSVMENLADILRHYGYWLIFALVLLDFLGTPLPSFLLLLGAGALAEASGLSIVSVSLIAALAALTGDVVLYGLGARKGGTVLRTMCRVTSDTNRCVRRTEGLFVSFGVAALFMAKVIPGLKVLATPMAGVMGMPIKRFIFYDGLGALTWAAAFTGVGHLCSSQVRQIGQAVERFTLIVALGSALLVLGYVIGHLSRQRWLLWWKKPAGESVIPQEIMEDKTV